MGVAPLHPLGFEVALPGWDIGFDFPPCWAGRWGAIPESPPASPTTVALRQKPLTPCEDMPSTTPFHPRSTPRQAMPAGRGRAPIAQGPHRELDLGQAPMCPHTVNNTLPFCHLSFFCHFVILYPHFIVFTLFSWHLSSLIHANFSCSVLKAGCIHVAHTLTMM